MEARVKISRETRLKLANPVMTEEDRRKLRITRIIEYIDKQPVGPLKHADVLAASGFDVRDANDYAKAKNLVEAMIRDGIIEHDGKKHSRSAFYKVKKTSLEATKIVRKTEISITNLENEAKEFACSTGSDSLREFIKFKLNNKMEEKANG